MSFRVGLLFYSSPAQPFVPGPVAQLLQRIEEKTNSLRADQLLTVVPFVRTTEMGLFAQDILGNDYLVEAVAFDEAGVTFGELDALTGIPHPKHNEVSDFNLGMNVLLTRCDVILVVCRDEAKALEVRSRLALHHNSSVFLALVPIRRGQPSFIEINPLLEDMDGPSWLLELTERWEAMDLRPYALPT